MPFGLCNASTKFMRLMNDVLHSYLDLFVIVYLNDILIYSSTWEDHISHITYHEGVKDSKKAPIVG